METINNSNVPIELQDLYNQLYLKISSLISGDAVFDIKKDPLILQVMVHSSMTIVENFKDVDGKGWSGSQKQRIALDLIKFVIADLSVKGKIDPIVAKDIIDNTDFWGGIMMNIAVDVAKGAIEVQKKGWCACFS